MLLNLNLRKLIKLYLNTKKPISHNLISFQVLQTHQNGKSRIGLEYIYFILRFLQFSQFMIFKAMSLKLTKCKSNIGVGEANLKRGASDVRNIAIIGTKFIYTMLFNIFNIIFHIPLCWL